MGFVAAVVASAKLTAPLYMPFTLSESEKLKDAALQLIVTS